MDAETYARIIAGDQTVTSGSEWRNVIRHYQADIASGRIRFGPSGPSRFGTGEGESAADADLMAFIAAKLPAFER